MRRLVLAAALLAAVPVQFAAAGGKSCYSPSDLEAEQAILFQTDLMVVSSACRDTVYGQFRLRNQDVIIHYQKAMIEHFRRSGARAPDREFETWITGLANLASTRQMMQPTAVVCQQAVELEKLAASLDGNGFRQYAVAHATSAPVDGHQRCAK